MKVWKTYVCANFSHRCEKFFGLILATEGTETADGVEEEDMFDINDDARYEENPLPQPLKLNPVTFLVAEMYNKYNLGQEAVMSIFRFAEKVGAGLDVSDLPKNFASFTNAISIHERFEIYYYYKCEKCDGDQWAKFLLDNSSDRRCDIGHAWDRRYSHFVFCTTRSLYAALLPSIWKNINRNNHQCLALQNLDQKVQLREDDIVLSICTDGFPLDKRGNKHTWPFLSTILGASTRLMKCFATVFQGVYQSSTMRNSDLQFMLRVILEDISSTSQRPIRWRDADNATHFSRVFVLNCIADSPGRASVLNMNLHTASYGCTYCYHQENGHYFSFTSEFQLRTQKQAEQYSASASNLETVFGHKGITALSVLKYFDIISGKRFIKI